MPVQNSDVAAQINRMADLLEIEDANPFRVRAYRNAARTVKGLARPVADLIKHKEDLTAFPGIGKDLANKIKEIISTGTFSQLEEIKTDLPAELPGLMNIEHIGPKRAKLLYQKAGISTPEDLKKAARAKKIRNIKGFGKKIEQSILSSLEQMADQNRRILLSEAEERAAPLTAHLEKASDTDRITLAGSFRRRKETVGDLHVHTSETDGLAGLEKMVEHARHLGYTYLAITDHSSQVTIANGMDIRRLEKQTERIIKAMENPCFNILGHPTGRLINRRKPYAVDLEKVMAAAKENGCFLELNAQPDRLDLSDEACRLARDMNVKIAVSSDAHDTGGLSHLRRGIDQARRGWLEPADVVNTSNCRDLIRMMTRI